MRALAMMRIRCRTWSNASTVSKSMKPASSSTAVVGCSVDRLEPGGRVVAEIADGAAGEPRQARHERRVEARHQLAQRGDERLVGLGRLSGAIDDRLAVPRAQDQERILAEERVAADLLAAFDRLEQERVVGVLGDLQERRDRRQQVGDDLLVDRHERAALRQLLEFFERRDLHSLVRVCPRTLQRALYGLRPEFAPQRRCHHARLRPLSGPPLELPLGLRDEHRQAVERQRSPPPSRRAAAASGPARRSGRRPAVHRTASAAAAIHRAVPAPPSGVQFTSRSHDPAAGGHAPAVAPSSCATSRACSGRRA